VLYSNIIKRKEMVRQMRKIRDTLGMKTEREELKPGMEEINVGMDEVKVVTYEDALNIALKVLEELY
jgi:hypothetical protein